MSQQDSKPTPRQSDHALAAKLCEQITHDSNSVAQAIADALADEREASRTEIKHLRRELDFATSKSRVHSLVLVGWYLAHHQWGQCSDAAVDYVVRELAKPRGPKMKTPLKKCLKNQIRRVADSLTAYAAQPQE